jgi:hypothetical protein
MTTPTSTTERSLVSLICDYESGLMDAADTIALFQRLIDTGMAWRLQGSYGRTAALMLQQGHCTLPAAR